MTPNVTFFPEGRQIIRGSDAMHSAMGSFISLAMEAAGADAASFFVVDEARQVLVPYVTVNLPEAYVAKCGPVALGDQCCGRAVLHKQQWIVSDMLIDPLFASAKAAAEATPIRAAFSTPILGTSGYRIGSVACHFREPHTPSTSDLIRNKLWAELIAHTVEENRESFPRADGPARTPTAA